MVHNDVHIHISGAFPVKGNSLSFEEFLIQKEMFKINKAVVFVNPIREDLYCCDVGDIVQVINCELDKCIYVCKNSKKINYIGGDPFRLENELLIKNCLKIKNVYPFIYLTMSKNTISNELNFFKKNYSGMFYGIKLHPNLCQANINELNFQCDLPLIIHCGTNIYDHPQNIIKFAKNYKGNICLAHWARFDEVTFRQIDKLNNVFIDTSPTYSLDQICEGNADDRWILSKGICQEQSELFTYVTNFVSVDKIIYGSDVPWGNFKHQKSFFSSLNINDDIKEKIFVKNFNRFVCQ